MRLLFIGNSHTFVHYVPLRVKEYLRSKGIKADVTMLTHPGMGLDWHLKQSQTYFNLIYGDYDAVILQHNAHPFPGRDSLVSSGIEMKKLVPEKTKVYLYMTWSEKKNPQGQKIMSESYEELAEKIDASICPVGKLWWQIKDKYPDELYFEDGEHTSVFGASLASAIIAKTILNEPLALEEVYEDAKRLEKLETDKRMIDLVMKDGEYAMSSIAEIEKEEL